MQSNSGPKKSGGCLQLLLLPLGLFFLLCNSLLWLFFLFRLRILYCDIYHVRWFYRLILRLLLHLFVLGMFQGIPKRVQWRGTLGSLTAPCR